MKKRDVTRAYREFDRRQDLRRYQVSQESQTRGRGLGLAIPTTETALSRESAHEAKAHPAG
ncbi:hypothetical protein SBA3_4190002 [Candidatus Sulfopaludibacter sp. SbA3]|nr:hypothetical protein SBA3_4190002 [Candidatus Sulfopaludibacter sp. SbA3]